MLLDWMMKSGLYMTGGWRKEVEIRGLVDISEMESRTNF